MAEDFLDNTEVLSLRQQNRGAVVPQVVEALVRQPRRAQLTDRGRPVALLSPLPVGSPYQQLLAEGEIIRATHNLDDLSEPLPALPGQEPASSVLARLRADER